MPRCRGTRKHKPHWTRKIFQCDECEKRVCIKIIRVIIPCEADEHMTIICNNCWADDESMSHYQHIKHLFTKIPKPLFTSKK